MSNNNPNDAYLAIRTIIEITRTYDTLEDIMGRHFARFGLSQPKFNAMMQMRQAGDQGLALSELGERMLVTRANITGLIDRMERDGLVVREADPKDRRVYRARLTVKATNLLNDILPIHADFTRQVMSVLSIAEKTKLTELLHKLRIEMEKI
ncbi:MarR family winged helix-turn-helix transcriptional regulator [Desulfoscipio gibsoniae]|uniref:Transcriptional regulator n=1 Tax=Desulfoscipio gibsoniae DSM 7213 TaxID=767817 RepID=R4KID7_9FIRM|nr:MarR family transcriptional regulator [Desulfoscipio gibsoniae]AGL02379.1 transcriptional regulator [Desulfoscipio gibsoniae DSM 7213]